MASKIRTLSVKVDADFSAIKKNTEIAAKAMKDGFGNFNLTQTQSALSGLNESIKLTRSEFKASVAGMDDWSESAEGLQARIKYLNDVTDDQRVILEGLKHQHQLVAKETGEDSKKATDLQVKINNQTADLRQNEAELKKVTEQLNNYGKETDDAKGKTADLGNTLKSFLTGTAIAAGARKAAEAIKEVTVESIDLASDLQEVKNVVDTTFGSNANKIKLWSDQAAGSFGLSSLNAQKFNGTLGAMLKSSGIVGDELAKMSTELVGAAGDFASFYNLDTEEAFNKIRQGISGETEGLKALGINLNQANLMQTEYVKSLGKTWDEMTMAEQATARYRAILELGKDALGDFTKTSGSYANQQRILQLQAENLKTAYGERLIPAATAFTQALNEMLEPATSVATITAKIGAADNTLMLVEKYKSLSKTVSDTSISSSALAEAQKELKTVKEQLISLSGGLITATENESDAFNSQVLNIEKLNSTEKDLLKAQLYAKIIEGNSALETQNNLENELNDSKAKQLDIQTKLNEVKIKSTELLNSENKLSLGAQELIKAYAQDIAAYTTELASMGVEQANINNRIEESKVAAQEASDAIVSLTKLGMTPADIAAAGLGLSLEDVNDILKKIPPSANAAADAINSNNKAYNDLMKTLRSADANDLMIWTSEGVSMAKRATVDITAAYDKALKDIQYKQGMGLISEEEYWKQFSAITSKYLTKNSDEWKAAQVAIHEWQQSQNDKALEEQKQASEKTADQLKKLQDEYDNTKEAARSSISGQLDLFKDIQDEAELSIDNFIESLKQQAEYVKEYNSNLKKAVELGIDKGLIEGLSDGSARSAVILGELVKSTQADIGKLNSAFSGLEIGKDEFASIVAGMNKGVTLGELGYNVSLNDDALKMPDLTAQTQLSSELKSTNKLEVTGKVTVEGVSDTGQLVGVTDVFADKLGDYLAQQSRRWPSAPSSNPYLAK